MTVAPGEDVQAAVDACPPGGSVLLLPGAHEGPLVLGPREVANGEGPPVQVGDKEVHVFGCGQATLRTSGKNVKDVLTSSAEVATVDGLVLRREASGGGGNHAAVCINGGRLRLQACFVVKSTFDGVRIEGGAGTNPVLASCK